MFKRHWVRAISKIFITISVSIICEWDASSLIIIANKKKHYYTVAQWKWWTCFFWFLKLPIIVSSEHTTNTCTFFLYWTRQIWETEIEIGTTSFEPDFIINENLFFFVYSHVYFLSHRINTVFILVFFSSNISSIFDVKLRFSADDTTTIYFAIFSENFYPIAFSHTDWNKWIWLFTNKIDEMFWFQLSRVTLNE